MLLLQFSSKPKHFSFSFCFHSRQQRTCVFPYAMRDKTTTTITAQIRTQKASCKRHLYTQLANHSEKATFPVMHYVQWPHQPKYDLFIRASDSESARQKFMFANVFPTNPKATLPNPAVYHIHGFIRSGIENARLMCNNKILFTTHPTIQYMLYTCSGRNQGATKREMMGRDIKY